MNLRIGHGYDIHPLKKGRRLILGGVEIEHGLGLAGHSDADVVVHALIDALLGAAALGDIGTHFPDTEPRYKDADSLSLLRTTMEMLTNGGWEIGNVDITILAEKPRLARHIPFMRKKISEALEVDVTSVSIKAKTGEGLGPVGKEEAIAAHTVAMLKCT